jgi:hypothetical protein
MTDLLVSHSQTGLSRDVLEDLVRLCRERGEPLGEYLVREQLVSHSAMRSVLLRHTCEAISDILSVPVAPSEGWSWVEHRGMGYSTALTFSPAEVFSGVHAIETPGVVASLTDRLAGALRRPQRAFAVACDANDLTPHAQIACDDLGVDAMFELVTQARELVALGAIAGARGIVAALDRFAYAVWREEAFIYVVVDSDELAFNRLISQLATINP